MKKKTFMRKLKQMFMRKMRVMRKFYVTTLAALCAVSTAMAQNADYSGLVLNELNGNDKFIELYNKGNETIQLNGVYIEKDGKNVWKAGDITLETGAYLLLYSEDVAADHPEHNSGLIFGSGLSAKKAVRVQLFTPTGKSIDDFNLVNDPATPAPASYSRCPDGTGAWTYAEATPNAANAESTTLVNGLADPEIDEDDDEDATPVDYSGLVLNELNGNDKFIELYNKGTEAIALKGVYIEKDGKNVWKAGDMTLEAGAYLLLYSEDVVLTTTTNPTPEHPEYEGSGLVFCSGLSAKKAVRVQLFTPTGDSLDDFNLTEYSTPAPASYSRCPDGTGVWTYADATPGAANAESTTMLDGLTDPEKVYVYISDAGYVTFCSNFNVDFNDTDVTVYTAKINDDNTAVELTEVESKVVPANSAVVLKGKEGNYQVAVVDEAARLASDNHLKVAASIMTGSAGNIYVLSKVEEAVGFYKLADEGTLGAGKCYLEYTSINALSFYGFGDDNTTDINNMKVDTEDNVYYDLQGRRVLYPTKGLYIVNGKKVLVK